MFSELALSYTTYGTLNKDASNVIWICHAFTANANPNEWWPGMVGERDFYNPKEHFIVCANILGSAYGSTSPLNCDEDKRYSQFPLITVRDIVNTMILLRKHLGVAKIHTLIGGSIGGHQALEWAIMEPNHILNLILCATSAQTSPWVTAFNQSQRLAIEADKDYYMNHPRGGEAGLKAARSIALLSYRNGLAYNNTQSDNFEFDRPLKSVTYQNYQGDKLVQRFNSYSYYSLTKTMDSHDVGRSRGSIENALKEVKANTLIIGISSDLLFPLSDSSKIANAIPHSEFQHIESDFGHDGFLIEVEKISNIIDNFYAKQKDISLFGLGCVGQGFYKLLDKSAKTNRLRDVFVKNDKIRDIKSDLISTTSENGVYNTLAPTIVELTDDSVLSYEMYQRAVHESKNFITANKKMVATHLSEIVQINNKTKSSVLYEAAVAGSIPIIKTLDSQFENKNTESITAILNGSSNYILTQMFEHNKGYPQALRQAQQLGFAETDPYSDVSGEDAQFKTAILAVHGFGFIPEVENILCAGIQNINTAAIEYAKQNDCVIKQIAQLRRLNGNNLHLSVLPHFVDKNTEIGLTANENNIIVVNNHETDFIFKGAGAGSIATATAVAADLKASDSAYRYHYDIHPELQLNYQQSVRVFITKHGSKSIPLHGEIYHDFEKFWIVDTTYKYLKNAVKKLQNDYFVCVIEEI